MTDTSAQSIDYITESVAQLNVEKHRSSSTVNSQLDTNNMDEEDIWGEDDVPNDASLLNREWKLRHEKFHKMGYVEGITAGKQASAQEGFNAGFNQSVNVGYKLGLVRGISSTLASLSDTLKEKLVETPRNKDRIQSLHHTLLGISSKDAQILFYDGIQQTTRQSPDFRNQLQFIFNEIELFTAETPAVKVNFVFGQECGESSSSRKSVVDD